MTEIKTSLTNPKGEAVPVIIRRDKRLKKTLRWAPEPDGSILVRVPQRYPKRHFTSLLRDIEKQLTKQKKKTKTRTDAGLQNRAEEINRQYFGGELSWEAIRWVNNMSTRLGSCTNGGSTDGHIRISSRIKDWPQWVIDYVIAHELAHRKHHSHGKVFWSYLQKCYPKTEQARGFIKGVSYAQGIDIEEE
jgi:predicted metal-dependent hydrolase